MQPEAEKLRCHQGCQLLISFLASLLLLARQVGSPFHHHPLLVPSASAAVLGVAFRYQTRYAQWHGIGAFGMCGD